LATIALIGGDGAGKTTVARELIASSGIPMKYLYMGILVTSANHALPTTRLVHRVRARSSMRPDDRERSGTPRQRELGRLGKSAQLLMRLTEESYRQVISWSFQLRGFVVVYDRHFVFEYELNPSAEGYADLPLVERLHLWFLRRLYPRPDLVIMLDAPPQQMYTRKAERSVDYLERFGNKYRSRSGLARRFVRVDASQPLESVVAEVRYHVDQFLSS
jgi:thymidylate kinase